MGAAFALPGAALQEAVGAPSADALRLHPLAKRQSSVQAADSVRSWLKGEGK